MIRLACVGDVHFGTDSAGTLSDHLKQLPELADVLILAGDLTWAGGADEAAVLAEELREVPLPKVAVLGNHDYHQDSQDKIAAILGDAGVIVLEGEKVVLNAGGCKVGIAGTKGFGGGFADACATEFGEPETKSFIRHTKELANRLEERLRQLQAEADVKIALMHYSPIRATLAGERLEIYPFLGSYLLAEAVDRAGADLVVHGHSHGGREKGVTPGGVQVRNVAQPVIDRAYTIYSLTPKPEGASGPAWTPAPVGIRPPGGEVVESPGEGEAEMQEDYRASGLSERPGAKEIRPDGVNGEVSKVERFEVPQVLARSDLATSINPYVFPARRDDLANSAGQHFAQSWVVDAIRRLPEGILYENVQQVWEALGGASEERF